MALRNRNQTYDELQDVSETPHSLRYAIDKFTLKVLFYVDLTYAQSNAT